MKDELVRTTQIFYEQWTTADAWAVHCSRSLLALSALIETVRLVSLGNKDWVAVLDESEVRFPVWVRNVHFGVLGVLVLSPVLISFEANRCKRGGGSTLKRVCTFCAFVAFLAHIDIFWHAFPVSITGGTRLNTIGLLAHAFIIWTDDAFAKGIGLLYLRFATCSMYVATAVNKITLDDSAWWDGTAVCKTLRCNSVVRRNAYMTVQYIPDVLKTAGTWVTLVLELGGGILLIVTASGGIRVNIIPLLSTLIFMHISMSALMVVGLFNLSCCANLLCFIPSRCHQRTRNATDKSSSLFIIYTTSMVVFIWLVSASSTWSENWHMFTTPPNACGHFVLAVVPNGSGVHERVHIVYDERPTSVRTASISANLRYSIAARADFLNHMEICIDYFVSSQDHSPICSSIQPHAMKLAAITCGAENQGDKTNSNAVILYWEGNSTSGLHGTFGRRYSPLLLLNASCDTKFVQNSPIIAPELVISLLRVPREFNESQRVNEARQDAFEYLRERFLCPYSWSRDYGLTKSNCTEETSFHSTINTRGIEDVLRDPRWPDTNPLSSADLTRYDENPDGAYYRKSRFLLYLGDDAYSALQKFYEKTFQEMPYLRRGIRVLDVGASWITAYPRNIHYERCAGVGMNEREMLYNKMITERPAVVDLNTTPELPYEENSFDFVTIAFSIEYYIKPLELMREIRRVLKPGGRVIVSFNQYTWLKKSVSIWDSCGDLGHSHAWIIGAYCHYSTGFEPPQAIDLSPDPKNSHFLYVVMATKVDGAAAAMPYL